MGRRGARRRLVWAIGSAALLVLAGAGLLWGADQVGTAAAEAPAGEEETGAVTEFELPVIAPDWGELAPDSGVEITSPTSGSALRGETLIRANWGDSSGFVVFRVDEQFAYATTHPYEMRWDTSTADDAIHTITADAYNDSARYEGTSSIQVTVTNTIPPPPGGVLLTVRYDEDDLLTRQITAHGEVSALTSDEHLPPGFDVLAGDLRCNLNQTVLDAFYEGVSALVRNRMRKGALSVGGANRTMSDVGRYAMVQVSQNGVAIPASASTTRPRLGVGEICLALQDYPVFPGETWRSPLGVVVDLYTRRAVFVQGDHSFQGLRWFRGQECAVVESTYRIPQLTLFDASPGRTSASSEAAGNGYQLKLTQLSRIGARGGRAGMPPEAMMGGPRRGPRAAQRPGQRLGQAAPGAARPGAAAVPQLTRARLLDLRGRRTTLLALNTGKILRSEDTIEEGKVEFRGPGGQLAAAPGGAGGVYRLELTQLSRIGARGGRAGMPPEAMMGGPRRGPRAAQRPGAPLGQRAARPGAPAAGPQKKFPARLDYRFHLVSDLSNP